MIFCYAKKPDICSWRECKGAIDRGDFCVREYMENQNTGQGFSRMFHYDCYLDYTLEKIRKWAINWQGTQNKPVKVGRPSVYTDGKLARNLQCLIKYHASRGHVSKTHDLELKLSKLIKH